MSYISVPKNCLPVREFGKIESSFQISEYREFFAIENTISIMDVKVQERKEHNSYKIGDRYFDEIILLFYFKSRYLDRLPDAYIIGKTIKEIYETEKYGIEIFWNGRKILDLPDINE